MRHAVLSSHPRDCVDKSDIELYGITALIKYIVLVGVYSCTLPTEWDGEWHDSSETTKDITFTHSDNYVVGWTHQIYSDSMTSWTCLDEDSSNNLLLFK